MSIESVVSWANKLKKNLWWRHALRLAANKGELDDGDLQLLFALSKEEAGLQPQSGAYAASIALLDLAGFGEEKHPVKLACISNVANVSALAPNKSIAFESEGLTAVYGDNGSGKSSYAKILKNACLTRGSTPKILSNIYDAQAGEPAADISLLIGEDKHDIPWLLSGSSHEDLKSIRIFDNTSSAHYISDEDSIDYKPAGMKLLSQLMMACDYVRAANESEKRPYNVATPLPQCTPGGRTAAFVSALSGATKPEAVDAICLSKEEDESISALKSELVKLQTSTPEQLRKGFSDSRKELTPLSAYFNQLRSKLDEKQFETIKLNYDDYQTKQAAAEIARKQAIEGHELSGICSPEWREMWNHVQTFVLKHNAALSFPAAAGEACPTCLQPVSEASAEKLKLFNDYLQDKTQMEASKAKVKFDSSIAALRLLSFDLKPYEFILGKVAEFNPEISKSFIALEESFKILCSNLTKQVPDFSIVPIDYKALDWINGQIVSLKTKEDAVKTNEGLTKQIATASQAINELDDRKLFTLSKQNILHEIERLRMIGLYNAVTQSCLSTIITTQTSNIAKMGAIGELSKVFEAELKKLEFRNFDVGTETRGSRGKQMLKLSMTGKRNNISDIASEGEQKCVALAGFMAELIVDDRKSAIVFDDPINSLDHKWRRKFAARVAEEAQSRQVIVFTHDMSFLVMLGEATKKANSKYSAISIVKRGKLAGFPTSEPPWDVKSTGDRVKDLNKIMVPLKQLEDAGDVDGYEAMAKLTYNKMRETWERLVEEWLFKKVVERFSRSVKTQSLKDVVEKGGITPEDYAAIEEGMSKCSTFMYGHDQAPELNEGVPDFAEVADDFEKLKAYFAALKARRTKK
ncbi:AAA family ATPase [Vibrio sp. OPT20]|nr:AAA family ATPase [Vibrio sp. OPT20]